MSTELARCCWGSFGRIDAAIYRAASWALRRPQSPKNGVITFSTENDFRVMLPSPPGTEHIPPL